MEQDVKAVVDPKLLALFRCPITGRALQKATAPLLAKVQQAIAAGSLENRCGQTVTTAVDDGLVDEQGEWFFPIRGGIITMVPDELISVSALE
jgi:uncharacterized protein YbaR (Trm112 family)